MSDNCQKLGPLADETAPCPVCSASMQGIEVGTKGRYGMPVRNIACEICGLVYVSPRPNQQAMNEYYRTLYRQHYESVYHAEDGTRVAEGQPGFEQAQDRWHVKQCEQAAKIAPLRNGEAVLEIGCRFGRTLELMRERSGILPFGIEPGESEAREARLRGIDCFCGPLEDYDPKQQRFDQIQLFHVLEHLHEPLQALIRLRHWLKDDGRLLIEVPNVYQPYGLLQENFFQNVHLMSFSHNTLSVLLKRAGFRLTTMMDAHVLISCATRDTSVTQLPQAFDAAQLPEPEQDAAWIAQRLDSYAQLEKMAWLVRYRDLDQRIFDLLIKCVQQPCLGTHLAVTVANLAAHCAKNGQPEAGLALAQAARRAPHPAECHAQLDRLIRAFG